MFRNQHTNYFERQGTPSANVASINMKKNRWSNNFAASYCYGPAESDMKCCTNLRDYVAATPNVCQQRPVAAPGSAPPSAARPAAVLAPGSVVGWATACGRSRRRTRTALRLSLCSTRRALDRLNWFCGKVRHKEGTQLSTRGLHLMKLGYRLRESRKLS